MTVTNPTTNPLPAGYAVTLGTVNQLALPYNGTRGGLVFYNDSSTAVIAICPSTQFTIAQGTAPIGANSTTTPAGVVSGATLGVAVINGPGSITLSPGQAFIIDNMQCTCAWNGIASASGAALTVLEH
jgi:hypothetical protein